jgi:hypothetical protein
MYSCRRKSNLRKFLICLHIGTYTITRHLFYQNLIFITKSDPVDDVVLGGKKLHYYDPFAPIKLAAVNQKLLGKRYNEE